MRTSSKNQGQTWIDQHQLGSSGFQKPGFFGSLPPLCCSGCRFFEERERREPSRFVVRSYIRREAGYVFNLVRETGPWVCSIQISQSLGRCTPAGRDFRCSRGHQASQAKQRDREANGAEKL
jgi:hypothetical protein